MNNLPGVLAVRAVNQYRRRDVIGYLGLRLYLANVCATRDLWAKEVACRLALHDSSPIYYVSLHFKEWNSKTKEIEYRQISLPTPNEVLAETTLLAECANAGDAFKNPDTVYSYQLVKGNEFPTIFQPYIIGFRRRHLDISKSARGNKDGIVVYTDIRRFYQSITKQSAVKAWDNASRMSVIPSWAINLGHKLLDNYSNCNEANQNGILTGPMFAHLVANLVLRNIDKEISEVLPGGYFRYVDDFSLVGSKNNVHRAEGRLVDLLNNMGLEINNNKRLEISTSQWLLSEHDFSNDSHQVNWAKFVGRMKQLLITRPEITKDITKQLASHGFRIAPLDYSDIVRERFYLDRLKLFLRNNWFIQLTHRATPDDLLSEAEILRGRYTSDFWQVINSMGKPLGYERKRMIYKLRQLASRLVYLASPDELPKIAAALGSVLEMELYSVVFDAIARQDVSNLVQYGANAAQSVVNGFLLPVKSIVCSTNMWTDAARQARGVLIAHGLCLQETAPEPRNEMERFCLWDNCGNELERNPKTYFGELAFLHGFGKQRLHEDLLLRAFDANEDMIVDIQNVLDQSY